MKRISQFIEVIIVLLVVQGLLLLPLDSACSASVPPEAARVAEVLKFFGNTDTANRFISDIHNGRVTFGNLKPGIAAETSNPRIASYNITFSNGMLSQINVRRPLFDTININWAVSIEHEYVHSRQPVPYETSRYEDPAWRNNVELIQTWMREVNNRVGMLRATPDSLEKVKKLEEYANWIKSLKSSHSDALVGVKENMAQEIVSKNIELPVIDMSYSRDIKYVEKKLNEKADLWEKYALSEAKEVARRLDGKEKQDTGSLEITEKQEHDLRYCVCKKGCAASARYNPEPLNASPSCKDVSNGPCVCQGFGCMRSRITREDTESCMKQLKISGDKLAVATWVKDRNSVIKPPKSTSVVLTPKTKNLALNKFSSQSSRSKWSTSNDPQGAVDGIKNGKFGFHTDKQLNPWWQVDLGKQGALNEVIVYNRLDYNPERSRTIQLLLSNDGTNWKTEYVHNGEVFGGIDGNPLKIRLNGKDARYLRLQLHGTTYFHLDEVEIMDSE